MELFAGFVTWVLMIAIFVLSFDAVRQFKFELFFYSHWLWLAFMVFMFVHGETLLVVVQVEAISFQLSHN